MTALELFLQPSVDELHHGLRLSRELVHDDVQDAWREPWQAGHPIVAFLAASLSRLVVSLDLVADFVGDRGHRMIGLNRHDIYNDNV